MRVEGSSEARLWNEMREQNERLRQDIQVLGDALTVIEDGTVGAYEKAIGSVGSGQPHFQACRYLARLALSRVPLYRKEESDAATAERDEAREQLREALEALMPIDDDCGERFCLVCQCFVSEGHLEDCAVEGILSRQRGGEGG
jgi:hypothetical protein